MDHKLVCWGDYAIPVPNDAKWMAFDKDGRSWVYERKPVSHSFTWGAAGFMHYFSGEAHIEPPEPGPWDTQLYWIGD